MTERTTSQAGQDDDANGLVALLTEQRDLYARLAGLAEHQRQLVTRGEAEPLLAVLGERQKIVNRLGLLGDRLRPYQQEWAAVRSRLGQGRVRQVDELLAEVNALLSGIIEKDEADVQALAARKTATAAAISGLSQRREAGAAYAAADEVRTQVDWADC